MDTHSVEAGTNDLIESHLAHGAILLHHKKCMRGSPKIGLEKFQVLKLKKSDYKVGDETESGAKIKAIIGANVDVIVFLSEIHILKWEVSDSYQNAIFPETIEHLDRIRNRIDCCVYMARSRRRLIALAGKHIYLALRDPKDIKSIDRLRRAMRALEAELVIHLRIYHVVTTLTSAAILCVLFYFLGAKNDSIIYSALIAGLIGVVLSILFSFTRVKVSPQATALRQVFDALVRVIYGCLCGVVAAIFMKAQLLGSVFVDKEYGLQAFCIVAGFCERMIPSILEKAGKKEEEEN